MRADAVSAPILRLAWLLILNIVPGARGLALASMVSRVSKTYIADVHQQPCRLVSNRSLSNHVFLAPLGHWRILPSSIHPPLKLVRACFFSCTGLGLFFSLY